MTPAIAFSLALALLLWPGKPAHHRLSRLRPSLHRDPGPRPTRLLLLIPPLTAALLAGIGGLLAATALTWTLHRQHTKTKARRQATHLATAQADALNLLVTQLRTGAHPALAAEAVAKEADPVAAPTLTALATAVRLGTHPDHTENRLLRAWHLSHNHGIPLADLLDTERQALEQRTRFTAQVEARMAGPKTTATLLATLPALALLLGEAMDAHPVHVLTQSPPGQLLLPLGALLICAGLEWSTHLTNTPTAPKSIPPNQSRHPAKSRPPSPPQST